MPMTEFEQAFHHPWLARELATDEPEVHALPFRTRTVASTEPPSVRASRQPSVPPLLQIAHDPQRFDLLPIVKSASSPWEERFLVGRAPNNDIVLRDPSVSKVHAHFVREADGQWRLVARGSRNGTLVDGRRLEVNESASVTSTMTVQFGNIRCTFLDSKKVFELLTAASA